MRNHILALLLMVLPLSVSAENSETQTRQQLEQLQKDIQQMQTLLNSIRGQRNSVEQQLGRSEQEIGTLHRQIEQIEQRLKEGQKRLKKLQTDQRKLVSSITKQQQQIGDTLRALYRSGQQPYLKLVLSQQDPQHSARMLHYYDYLNRAHNLQISNYRQQLERVQQLNQQIEQTQLSHTNQRNQLHQKRSHLLSQQTERQRLMERLKRTLQKKDKDLANKQAQQAELKQILDSLQTAITNLSVPGKPFKQQRGKMRWPVKGKVSHRFGTSKGDKQRWNGLYISAREGAPVKAIHHGRVVFSDWLRGFGLLLIVDHGDDYLSLYAHNRSLLKELGEWVNAGDTIASVGNSGGQQNNGLYFEVRYRGKPQNPLRCCLARQ
ncbi:murein hydrolase activator EnvC family protein [Aestuariirhabdus sp. LZHN29]|uniref:murein hydrolase activator EnvC family protein n=1 Tax=Aestuariirhabdus sp. LZHN29 TaxID=3417462 RepID=UPI003CFB4B2B